jgi:peptidoglycan/xylan/chitin deacetylase (PgdA/CDA1 family)
MLSRLSTGLAGLALLMFATAPAAAQCPPSAIGMSREVAVDATGGPRFGHNQYPGPDFLRPGEVVLTFDDGPHKQLTPAILDTLDAHCVKATFFMVGQRVQAYPAIVREVARRGHTVGTHTWSHQNLKQISQDAAINEIELGMSAVRKALGQPGAPFFRFPYLSDPAFAIQHLRQRNTAIFSIDVDSYDFRTRSPTNVMRNVMSQLKTKRRGIILFHDIQPSTAGALGALLGDLKADGYKVVHLVPRGQQSTIATYDQRLLSRPEPPQASPGLAMRHRAAVNPAWEPRVMPSGPPPRMAVTAPPLPQAPLVAEPRPPRPARVSQEDDWRSRVFRGY